MSRPERGVDVTNHLADATTTLAHRCAYWANLLDFSRASEDQVFSRLAKHLSFDLVQNQKSAWIAQISHLQRVAATLEDGTIFFEFLIPRMGKRADVVIVRRGVVFVLEYKVGETTFPGHAIDQVVDYALDLKNFHAGSHGVPIVPVLVSTRATTSLTPDESGFDGVLEPVLATEATLSAQIVQINRRLADTPKLDPMSWATAGYKPTPTIVEAAQALYQGHDVREISRNEAGAENLARTGAYINDVIEVAKACGRKVVCFVTGVPGSGKTLAGLSIANSRMNADEDEHAVFLSGNGPLVAVLREALARDEVERGRATGNQVVKKDALRRASSFVQNIHHFRDEALSGGVPIERVVVFDEAQRAWNRTQASHFMRQKRGQLEFDQSEPEFLLSVMDRHEGWCVVVCLVGGGQEINTGEGGLGEWLQALSDRFRHWEVHVSDRLGEIEYIDAQRSHLIDALAPVTSDSLHLAVSVRSFRAEAVSDFVAAVVAGDVARARSLFAELGGYPIVLARDLETARAWLRSRARGSERTGLVASSNALRLKPVGIHVKAGIDPPDWFLNGSDDVRSSYALEDVGTEFDVQGLELDWVGVCWDANFRYSTKLRHWQALQFRGTRWQQINDPARRAYLENSYRVLLTRARQGMVIIVPEGSTIDWTRNPAYYDGTFGFLQSCGIPVLGG